MPIRLIAPDRTGIHWFDGFRKSIEDALNKLKGDLDAEAAKTTLTVAYAHKSASYTLTAADCAVSFDCSGGARTATLPPAASVPGRVYLVKKTDGGGNSLTLDGDGAETIDGSATKSTTIQNAGWTLISTGSAWQTFP